LTVSPITVKDGASVEPILLSSTTADFGPEVVINLLPSPAARSPTCRLAGSRNALTVVFEFGLAVCRRGDADGVPGD
jgi:hypothetical protein